MLQHDGVATLDQIKKVYPSEERRKKGAYAVFECFQNIPCNPCRSSCPAHAIELEEICDLPKVNFDKCNGCGICVSTCPGLAIFVIDETFSDTHAIIKLPYEFLPLPNKGEIVKAIDRAGNPVCDASVLSVQNTKNQNKTPLVWLIIPKERIMEVRFFAASNNSVASLFEKNQNATIGQQTQSNQQTANQKSSCQNNAETCNGISIENNQAACDCVSIEDINDSTRNEAYVCRCEELTVAQIRKFIAEGYTTLDEIKRISRAGMGACQGRTCRQLIMNEIAAATGIKQDQQPVTTFRPTVSPIKMHQLCGEDTQND